MWTQLSPRGSQIFSQYNLCENVSRRSWYTQSKLWKSYSLCMSEPSLTTVNLPWGGDNGSLNIQCLCDQGSCVIERWLSNFCLQNKTAEAHGKRDIDNRLTMPAMSFNFALVQKLNKSFTTCKDQSESLQVQINMRIIFHINDIFNDS